MLYFCPCVERLLDSRLKIALLDVLIPVAEYREIRMKYLEVKNARATLRLKVQKLKEKNAPAHDLLKYVPGLHHGYMRAHPIYHCRKLEQSVKDVDTKREGLKKSTQAKFKKLGAKSKSNDELVCFLSYLMIMTLNEMALLGNRMH